VQHNFLQLIIPVGSISLICADFTTVPVAAVQQLCSWVAGCACTELQCSMFGLQCTLAWLGSLQEVGFDVRASLNVPLFIILLAGVVSHCQQVALVTQM
jgi:hypothetical protein